MDNLTRPLREEHRELWPHIEEIREVADFAEGMSPEAICSKVNEVSSFLKTHLVPHARAEEAVLYPVVSRLMGSADATATMARDHLEIMKLTTELEEMMSAKSDLHIKGEGLRSLRRLLYGLYALVGVHFAKEEEIYLPLLDEKLTHEEANAMFEALRIFAHGTKEDHQHQR